MLVLGIGLFFGGFALITWGAAQVAHEAKLGPPPGGCALIVLWVASAQTKAGKIGWVMLLLGLLFLSIAGTIAG